MPRCFVCNKKASFFTCSYCKNPCCSTCLQPEYHKCTEIKKCVTEQRGNLKTKLYDGKTVAKKIVGI